MTIFASTSTSASTPALRGKTAAVLSAAVLGALLLAGCAGEPSEAAAEPSATAAATAADPAHGDSAAESPLAFHESWVKAAESGMTAAFGVLANSGTEDIQVIAAASPAAETVQLHETTAGADGSFAMAETAKGFTVPAGGEFVLEPGANHLMLMGLKAPVLPGDDISFSLELADGTSVDFTATAKEFSGANESYHG